MKELTLTLALTTPIIFGLDLQATNIIIAFCNLGYHSY